MPWHSGFGKRLIRWWSRISSLDCDLNVCAHVFVFSEHPIKNSHPNRDRLERSVSLLLKTNSTVMTKHKRLNTVSEIMYIQMDSLS